MLSCGFFGKSRPVEGRRQEQPHLQRSASVSCSSLEATMTVHENGTYNHHVCGKTRLHLTYFSLPLPYIMFKCWPTVSQ